MRELREDNRRRELGRSVQQLQKAKEEEVRLQAQYNQAILDLSQLASKHVTPLINKPVTMLKVQEIETHTKMQRGKISQAMQSQKAAVQQTAEMQKIADTARKDYLDAHRSTERLNILQKEVFKKEQRILDIRQEEEPF